MHYGKFTKIAKTILSSKVKESEKNISGSAPKVYFTSTKKQKIKNMGKNITCETYCGDKVHFKLATLGDASHLCVGSKTKASVVGLMCFGLTV